jgi:hypothetical protein
VCFVRPQAGVGGALTRNNSVKLASPAHLPVATYSDLRLRALPFTIIAQDLTTAATAKGALLALPSAYQAKVRDLGAPLSLCLSACDELAVGSPLANRPLRQNDEPTPWASVGVEVQNGIVTFTGPIIDERLRGALKAIGENTPRCVAAHDHMARISPIRAPSFRLRGRIRPCRR